jgi:acetyl-CoA carboxylase biotin carboxyl carrier protein
MPEVKVLSELSASVWKIEVAAGDRVEAEQSLILLESMKMEIPVPAPRAGTVKSILVKEQDTVSEGQPLVIIDA